jgi:hypothetical protein
MSEFRFAFPACVIAGKHRLAAEDIGLLRKYTFPDGIRTADDVVVMLALNNACPEKCHEWNSFFVEQISAFIVSYSYPMFNENPDRQPRRDRLPGHQDGAPHGHQDGRRLFRCRSRCAACRDGRRGRAYRPPAAAQSYLVIEKIIEACKQTGAEAVHPGYGFLSEREAFCEALEGKASSSSARSPGAIAAMGDKIESKKFANAAKVSTVPGYLGVIETPSMP